jgi:hypothetical protein
VIRPITCVCFLLACGSGLYLYQAKHRVNVLDEQIRQTVRATDAVREQIRLLHAEWTRLSQPDRLQQLADQFLSLKTTNPSQFTSMAELGSRLPPVPPPQPEPVPAAAPPADEPVVSAAPMPPPPAGVPTPPTVGSTPPASGATSVPVPKVAEVTPPAAPHPTVDHPHGPLPPSASAGVPRPTLPTAHTHPAVIEAADRPVWTPRKPSPMPVAPPSPPPAPAASGSLLGMAHTAVPAPAPIPFNSGWGPNGN